MGAGVVACRSNLAMQPVNAVEMDIETGGARLAEDELELAGRGVERLVLLVWDMAQ